MLLSITAHCEMGCTHCMHDAVPDHRHMTFETLEKVMKTINERNLCRALLISGGEPCSHPEFLKFFNYIVDHFHGGLFLCTNGVKLAHTPEYLEAVRKAQSKSLMLKVQVTDDPRYYPRALTEKEKKALSVLDPIIDPVPSLTPMGRALKNFPDYPYEKTTKATKCANTQLIAMQIRPDLSALVDVFESSLKFCTPMIRFDGKLSPGESYLCPDIGYLWDTDEVIFDKINHLDCHKCTLAEEIFKKNSPKGWEMLKSRRI